MARSDQPLAAADRRSVGLALPVVLNDNVNALLAMAREQGKKFDRQDIVAALVFGGPRDSEGLQRLIADYEAATVGSARIRGAPRSTEGRRPGRVPRARKA